MVFLTRLHFARTIDPQLAQRIIMTQSSALRQHLSDLRAEFPMTESSDDLRSMARNLRLRQLESALAWLDERIAVTQLHPT